MMARGQNFMKEINLIPNLINYKLIEHERVGDAPFVGALISACNCTFDCSNCFNQHIKKLKTITKSSKEIIAEVQSNVFNQGIIFAGLEWTLQLDECILLAAEAKKHELLTMIYTGNIWESSVVKKIIKSHVFDYIKCGQYDEALKTANHVEYGIVLASSNQHIYKKGVDYA